MCLRIFLLYIKIRAEKGLFINVIVFSISQCVRKIHQVDWKSNSAFWLGIESLGLRLRVCQVVEYTQYPCYPFMSRLLSLAPLSFPYYDGVHHV